MQTAGFASEADKQSLVPKILSKIVICPVAVGSKHLLYALCSHFSFMCNMPIGKLGMF